MKLREINNRLSGKTIVRTVRCDEKNETQSMVFPEARYDTGDPQWCYISIPENGLRHIVRVSLLEELVMQGSAVFHRTNECEIEAHRKAKLSPLPEWKECTVTYSLK